MELWYSLFYMILIACRLKITRPTSYIYFSLLLNLKKFYLWTLSRDFTPHLSIKNIISVFFTPYVSIDGRAVWHTVLMYKTDCFFGTLSVLKIQLNNRGGRLYMTWPYYCYGEWMVINNEVGLGGGGSRHIWSGFSLDLMHAQVYNLIF